MINGKRPAGGRSIAAVIICLLCILPSQGFAYECPKPAQQLARDVSIKIQSTVSSLPERDVPKFDARAETVTRDLFAQYPNADRVILAHSITSIFCQVLFESKFSDAQKLDELYRFEEKITRITGLSVPIHRTTGTTCSTDPKDVLRPVNAVFEAWANLDLAHYLAQWGPESIQRSKYYARKKAEIESRRTLDFRKYSSVKVVRIDPKILFRDGTKARVDNVYSMRFVRRDGRVYNETMVAESYILECSATDRRWIIRENNDYLLPR